MLPLQKLLFSILIFIIVLGAVGYGIFAYSPLIARPELSINYPQNGQIVSGTELTVRGEAKNVNTLTINDYPVQISKSGLFETRLAIWEGSSIIKVTGYDRFGRSVSVERTIGTQ